MKKRDIIEKLSLIVLIMLVIGIAYMVLLKITGHSPTAETIVGTLLTSMMVYVTISVFKMKGFEGEMKEFKRATEKTLSKMEREQEEIKRVLYQIQAKIEIMQANMEIMQTKIATLS